MSTLFDRRWAATGQPRETGWLNDKQAAIVDK